MQLNQSAPILRSSSPQRVSILRGCSVVPVKLGPLVTLSREWAIYQKKVNLKAIVLGG
jgi:hypothetical protein